MEEKVRMLSPTICMQDVHGCECSWQQYEHVKDPTQAGGSEHNSKPEDIELLLTPIPLVYSSSSLRTSSMFVFGCLPIISPKAASAHCTPSLYIELVYWLISWKLCSLTLGAAFFLWIGKCSRNSPSFLCYCFPWHREVDQENRMKERRPNPFCRRYLRSTACSEITAGTLLNPQTIIQNGSQNGLQILTNKSLVLRAVIPLVVMGKLIEQSGNTAKPTY